MTARTLVTFQTDIPDDAIETEDGMDFLQWPGRNVVQVITDLLIGLGWAPEDPFDLQERGWDLDATFGDKRVSLRIAVPEAQEVMVIFTDRSPDRTWYFKRKPSGPVFRGMLAAFDQALKADHRFRDIVWFVPHDYPSPELGAPSPVELTS